MDTQRKERTTNLNKGYPFLEQKSYPNSIEMEGDQAKPIFISPGPTTGPSAAPGRIRRVSLQATSLPNATEAGPSTEEISKIVSETGPASPKTPKKVSAWGRLKPLAKPQAISLASSPEEVQLMRRASNVSAGSLRTPASPRGSTRSLKPLESQDAAESEPKRALNMRQIIALMKAQRDREKAAEKRDAAQLTLRQKINCLFDAQGSDYPSDSYRIASKMITTILLLLVVLSLVTYCVESLPQFIHTQDSAIRALEFLCSITFTLEFFIRLYASEKRLRFLQETSTWVDVLSFLPLYVELLVTLATNVDSGILDLLRMIRIVRLFKVCEHNQSFMVVVATLKDALSTLKLILFIFILNVIIFSSIMFFAEQDGQEFDAENQIWVRVDGTMSPFQSIFDCMYWCIVTQGTTGYGDAVPRTVWGWWIAAVTMYAGLVFLGFPTVILSHHYKKVTRRLVKRMLAETEPTQERSSLPAIPKSGQVGTTDTEENTSETDTSTTSVRRRKFGVMTKEDVARRLLRCWRNRGTTNSSPSQSLRPTKNQEGAANTVNRVLPSGPSAETRPLNITVEKAKVNPTLPPEPHKVTVSETNSIESLLEASETGNNVFTKFAPKPNKIATSFTYNRSLYHVVYVGSHAFGQPQFRYRPLMSPHNNKIQVVGRCVRIFVSLDSSQACRAALQALRDSLPFLQETSRAENVSAYTVRKLTIEIPQLPKAKYTIDPQTVASPGNAFVVSIRAETEEDAHRFYETRFLYYMLLNASCMTDTVGSTKNIQATIALGAY